MNNNSLMASVALFRNLYDNNKDIYDVISEFIRISITINACWSFDVTRCGGNLKKDFGFEIPDAVINTCLKKRLQNKGELTLNHGVYSTTNLFDRSPNFQNDFDKEKIEYAEIIKTLVIFVNAKSQVELNSQDEELLTNNFNNYLLSEKTNNKYAELISGFVLQNQNNQEFKSKLNRIEEGLILYEGIKYSPNLATLGKWSGHLVVYLDTELLFSAAGLNGVLHKKIFEDFHSLVREVNRNPKNGSISLRYFEETEQEIENFFYAAAKIVENSQPIDPSKTAMVTIINGSATKSDVLERKAKFISTLQGFKISLEERKDYYDKPQFNIESAETISNLIAKYNHQAEAEIYRNILKFFTKINYLRLGINNQGIEQSKAIFMTAHGLTISVAFSEFIYNKGETPFATNLEHLTERLWFKLNKGFGEGIQTPISFDVITRAKLVLSTQINNSISTSYKELIDKHNNGNISIDEASYLYSELRDKASKPEDLTVEIIDGAIDFLSYDLIEKSLSEKSIIEKTSEDRADLIKILEQKSRQQDKETEKLLIKTKEGDSAIEALKKIKYKSYRDKQKYIKKFINCLYWILMGMVYVAPVSIIIYSIALFYTTNDTKLSILFGAITAIGFVMQLFSYDKMKYLPQKLAIASYKFFLKSSKDTRV